MMEFPHCVCSWEAQGEGSGRGGEENGKGKMETNLQRGQINLTYQSAVTKCHGWMEASGCFWARIMNEVQ